MPPTHIPSDHHSCNQAKDNKRVLANRRREGEAQPDRVPVRDPRHREPLPIKYLLGTIGQGAPRTRAQRPAVTQNQERGKTDSKVRPHPRSPTPRANDRSFGPDWRIVPECEPFLQ